MVAMGLLAYFGARTLVVCFWDYGIWAFVRDARGTYLPLRRQYRRGRRIIEETGEREREREEREEQLY
jgi:hypothetical protein